MEHGVSKGVFAFNSYRLISYIKSLSADVLAASPYAVAVSYTHLNEKSRAAQMEGQILPIRAAPF